MEKRYKVVIAQSGKMDVKNKKRYILEKFKYRDYANNFSAKIKRRQGSWIHYQLDMKRQVLGIGVMRFI